MYYTAPLRSIKNSRPYRRADGLAPGAFLASCADPTQQVVRDLAGLRAGPIGPVGRARVQRQESALARRRWTECNRPCGNTPVWSYGHFQMTEGHFYHPCQGKASAKSKFGCSTGFTQLAIESIGLLRSSEIYFFGTMPYRLKGGNTVARGEAPGTGAPQSASPDKGGILAVLPAWVWIHISPFQGF